MKRTFTCIVCPNGCRLTVEGEPGALTVTGNLCAKGAAFAESELTHPLRTLTTTVKTQSEAMPMLPVRTQGEIPKEALHSAMAALAGVCVAPPVRRGATVLANVAGTGVDVVASCDLE